MPGVLINNNGRLRSMLRRRASVWPSPDCQIWEQHLQHRAPAGLHCGAHMFLTHVFQHSVGPASSRTGCYWLVVCCRAVNKRSARPLEFHAACKTWHPPKCMPTSAHSPHGRKIGWVFTSKLSSALPANEHLAHLKSRRLLACVVCDTASWTRCSLQWLRCSG